MTDLFRVVILLLRLTKDIQYSRLLVMIIIVAGIISGLSNTALDRYHQFGAEQNRGSDICPGVGFWRALPGAGFHAVRFRGSVGPPDEKSHGEFAFAPVPQNINRAVERAGAAWFAPIVCDSHR